MNKAILLLLLFYSVSLADPGNPDTLRIGEITAFPAGSAVLPVYFYNDELLSAVEIVIHYNHLELRLDSISTAGSRVEYIDPSNVILCDSSGLLDLWIPDFVSFIPEGNGLLARIYFSLTAETELGLYSVDSITWPTPIPIIKKTSFSDQLAYPIYPEIVSGSIALPSYCGDLTLDNIINILDIIFFINYKFKNGALPTYERSCDVNHDNQINILDIVYLVNFKFSFGLPPYCIN